MSDYTFKINRLQGTIILDEEDWFKKFTIKTLEKAISYTNKFLREVEDCTQTISPMMVRLKMSRVNDHTVNMIRMISILFRFTMIRICIKGKIENKESKEKDEKEKEKDKQENNKTKNKKPTKSPRGN